MRGNWPNPWQGRIIPVPTRELARALAEPKERCRMADGSMKPMDTDFYLSHWSQYGIKLDAYLLPGPSYISAGVRYGPRGEQYLSPYPCNQDKLKELIKKYSKLKKIA